MEVGGTKILVGVTEDGNRQVVVYKNYVSVEFEKQGRRDAKKLEEKLKAVSSREKNNAMILPFPCMSQEDDVQLLDLSANKNLFSDLKECFPFVEAPRKKSRSRSRSRSYGKDVLEVHRVGSYNVSVAKSIADLRR